MCIYISFSTKHHFLQHAGWNCSIEIGETSEIVYSNILVPFVARAETCVNDTDSRKRKSWPFRQLNAILQNRILSLILPEILHKSTQAISTKLIFKNRWSIIILSSFSGCLPWRIWVRFTLNAEYSRLQLSQWQQYFENTKPDAMLYIL